MATMSGHHTMNNCVLFFPFMYLSSPLFFDSTSFFYLNRNCRKKTKQNNAHRMPQIHNLDLHASSRTKIWKTRRILRLNYRSSSGASSTVIKMTRKPERQRYASLCFFIQSSSSAYFLLLCFRCLSLLRYFKDCCVDVIAERKMNIVVVHVEVAVRRLLCVAEARKLQKQERVMIVVDLMLL
ncbi:hypothetical protein RYX36_030824 [Vicia faba]